MWRLGCLGALVVALSSAPAADAASVVLVRDNPLPNGPAPTHVWQTPQASVTAGGSAAYVSVKAESSGSTYYVSFEPRRGDVLAAGRVYDHAADTPDPTAPYLSITGDGTTCAGGRFEILDAGFGANGEVQRLWAVFACGAERPATFGEVRVGMGGDLAPAHVRWPATDAGWSGSAVPVTFTAPKALTVAGATLVGADAAAFAVVSDGCSGKALASAGRCTVSVAHKAAAAGTVDAKLRLSLSDGSVRESRLEGFAFGGTTRLTVTSESGDPVGKGASYEYGPGSAGFLAGGNLFDIGAQIRAPNVTWDISVTPPEGDILAPGQFSPAERFPFSYGAAGLAANVTENSTWRGCSNGLEASSFTIQEMRDWPSGAPRSSAVDFVQRCKGASGSLRGTLSLRRGDTTPLPPWIDERAGPVPDPETPGGSVVFYSDPDDYIGQGGVKQWSTPRDAVEVAGTSDVVRVRTGGHRGVEISVRAPVGRTLEPGIYDHAVSDGAGDAEHPELYVVSNHLAGGHGGRFEILDYARRSDGSVARLWLVFEGRTPSGLGAAHFGEVRYGIDERPLVPARLRFPETDAGRRSRVVPLTFVAPRSVSLSPAALTGANAAAFAVRYDGCAGRQLAPGERCRVWLRHTATNPGTARATLQLTDGDGATYETAVDAFAWGGTTRVALTSESEDDWVGQGRSYAYGPATARFRPFVDAYRIDFALRTYLDDWRLLVAPEAGGSLSAPHTYSGAQWWSNAGPGPYMAMFGNGRACDYLEDSWFRVDELALFPSGEPRSVVVAFEQHCNGGPPFRGTWSFRAGDTTQPAPWMLSGKDGFAPPGAVNPTPTPTHDPSPDPTPTPTSADSTTAGPTPGHPLPGDSGVTPDGPSVPAAPPCSSRRVVSIRLRTVPARVAVLRIDGRPVRLIRPRTRRVRVSFVGHAGRRAVVTVKMGRRTLVRRVYRLCVR